MGISLATDARDGPMKFIKSRRGNFRPTTPFGRRLLFDRGVLPARKGNFAVIFQGKVHDRVEKKKKEEKKWRGEKRENSAGLVAVKVQRVSPGNEP